jgi:orotate phosphoribosyltransferase-like protein
VLGGFATACKGSAHGRSKLTEDLVVEMRRLRLRGWSTGRLAKHFNVARNTVCYALNGTTWSHVPNPQPSEGI